MAANKHDAFVNEYLKDFNGVKAAERAGYTGSYFTLAAQASRLLKNAKVREKLEQRFAVAVMETDELLWRLGEKARFNIAEYLVPKGDGWAVDVDKLKADGRGHLIRSIKNTRDGQNIELADPDAAQQLIGKHLRLFTDRTESLNIDLSKLTNEQLSRIANGESPLDVMANPSASGD